MTASIPRDSTAEDTATNQAGSLPAWLEKEQKTWEAPTLVEQMTGVETFIPIGKGAIFVPRLSTAAQEPIVTILDSAGHAVTSGNSVQMFNVEPGAYTVEVGSGGHGPAHGTQGHARRRRDRADPAGLGRARGGDRGLPGRAVPRPV